MLKIDISPAAPQSGLWFKDSTPWPNDLAGLYQCILRGSVLMLTATLVLLAVCRRALYILGSIATWQYKMGFISLRKLGKSA